MGNDGEDGTLGTQKIKLFDFVFPYQSANYVTDVGVCVTLIPSNGVTVTAGFHLPSTPVLLA